MSTSRAEAAEGYSAMAERALGWVHRSLDLFELPSLEDPHLVDALKPLGELVLTLDVVCDHSSGPPADSAREIIAWAWEQTARGAVLERVVLEHRELVTICWLYEIFHRHGYEHLPFLDLVESLVGMRSVSRLEMVPWRELELATSLLDLGIASPFSREASLGRTWLAALPEPWEMNVSFGYSVTHTVFYATRFGRHPEDLPAPMREHAAKWWPVWTRFFVREHNLDLVAELVMTARCLGLEDQERLDLLLLEAQRADGLLPGPAPPGSSTPSEDSRRELFDAHYHTTLVGLMAAVMSVDGIGQPR